MNGLIRMNGLGCLILGLALAGSPGCSAEPAEVEHGTMDLVEGSPCHWQDAICMDEVEMLHCHDGEWVQQSCTEYCGSLGSKVSSVGCDTEESMARPDLLCSCAPPEDGCHPGQARCDSDDTLGWCADDWTWHSASCEMLCDDRSLRSRGCGSFAGRMSCLCTNVGMKCEGDLTVCASDAAIASCEGGEWTERDCSDVCGAPALCDPGHPDGAACDCATN